VNPLDDTNSVKPPVRGVTESWTSDSNALLFGDHYDLWQVSADGGQWVNLTGNGKKDSILYGRNLTLDPEQDPIGEGIDTSQPMYIPLMEEWTKKAGIARIVPGTPGAQRLLWDDAKFGRLLKAKNADVFVYSRETRAAPPDLYAAGRDLAGGRKLTDFSAQQRSIAWSSGRMLLDFTSAKGDKLQAALYLPSNYEKGKAYPTIVHVYERLTQSLNEYPNPVANGFDPTLYTSHGYAVLDPDIKYRVNDPGMSAVWCVLPALKAAIGTGIVDARHVGLQGYSWGGYETAFLVTQTDVFAAAAPGAPITDMISEWGLIYKNNGTSCGAMVESSQGRFAGPPLEYMESYIRNSPILHAANVKAPVLILANDQDGAVDFTQGIEYFQTLRRLSKPVVLLEYPGENHVLANVANQTDYTLRMKAFFDHFLKGAPAPRWWSQGISRIELQAEIQDGRVAASAVSH
jgi:dipeptidyl aminopeptidase/acylaminoacyl peptidase